MFKRFMPLLFVVLVVLATAAIYLVFRDSDTPPPTQPPPPAPVTREPGVAPDGLPEYRVESEAEYQRALEALGTSTDEIEAWARSRGFPPATYTGAPGTPLARNYARERISRLRELAEEGDRWAMHFLAERIYPEHPQEGIEWYRQAIVRGSAYSAFKLGSLYREVARWVTISGDDREEVLEIAAREDPLAYSSLGWLLVAEYEAGLPPGAIAATLVGLHSRDEGIDRSCERAAGFLEDIQAMRDELDIELDVKQPPLAVELPPEEVAGYCDPEVFPRADFSDCKTVRFSGDLGSVLAHRCR